VTKGKRPPQAAAQPPSWRRLLAPRYWPTWLGLGVLRLLALLPYAALLRLGALLGGLLRRALPRYVRTARRNIELCLPEVPPHSRERLLRQHFASLGIALFEIALAWWGSAARLEAVSRVEGIENVRAALARGRGAILLAAHFTHLEIGARILAAQIPINVVYRPTKNEALAFMMSRIRCRHGGHAIRRDDIRSVVAALRANECVWYAPDQSYRNKGAEMVPMFGIPAATNTATSRIARMTGAAVLPYFVERLPGGAGYRAVVHAALEGFPGESPRGDAERFHHLIEAHVRAVPEQYLWIHRRFKGLSADYPDYYARRRSAG
jgi:KDO2-lipid IV(A) lauroyltransferase